jgi:uncharacterized cupredoxin-like copper-binding protein
MRADDEDPSRITLLEVHTMYKTVGILAAITLLAAGGAAWGAGVQKVTITMHDFSYTPATVTLQAGVPAEITLVNKGKVAHEWMAYGMPKPGMMMGGQMGHEWVEQTNYFHMGPVQATGGKVTRHAGDFMEMQVAPGGSATIRFTPTKKGAFEMGCMIEGHYEAGQHGVLTVK